ncbi:MAG: hypothetical protein NPINA01_27640 [Nitrospinaceae bacterium]|nr:MAG: hypothetical protein NPINA01_27640 [Nitrospinaceae bacterium]
MDKPDICIESIYYRHTNMGGERGARVCPQGLRERTSLKMDKESFMEKQGNILRMNHRNVLL